MNLLKCLSSAQILLQVDVTDQNDLFRRMVQVIATADYLQKNPRVTAESIYQAVLAREAQRSTAIGCGMALPHARMDDVETLGLAIATLKNPMSFSSDSDPVQLVFMVITPSGKPTISLQVMSGMLRCFSGDVLRTSFCSLQNSEFAYQHLCGLNLRIDTPICARDIMRQPGNFVHPDTSLKEVARLMFEKQLDVLPVLDAEKRLVGEITTNRLFRFGLPEFFQKLQSVSFIAEFDPFEKYFAAEAHSKASDLMSKEFGAVAPDHTMLEVVFDLAVKRYPQLYIIDEDQRWIGTIERSTVLDKVINF